jgi:anti-sigma B factor antagonist
MKIAEYVGNNIVILEPHGRLTLETAQSFRKAVVKRVNGGWPGVILDLQHVTYVDSAGLGALIRAHTLCQKYGTRLVFVHVVGKNLELLTITKLLTVFEVYETTLEAERSLRASAERYVAPVGDHAVLTA